VVPSVVGHVVVAFHDMHAGQRAQTCDISVVFQLYFSCIYFNCVINFCSREGHDTHQRTYFWRESGQGKVKCDV
jgi:hypothetical protein